MPSSSKPLTSDAPICASVMVVDDDADLRAALKNLFRSVGLKALLFGSARELLQAKFPDAPSCIVLDIRLPGVSGLDSRISSRSSISICRSSS